MILLMGPAGAGKSVQGHKLADEYGFAYISSGEIFRLFITGKRRADMLEGKLLSDDEVVNVFDKVLDIIDTSEEFILDGFPRTSKQVEWVLQQSAAGRFDKPTVVHLDLDETEIRKRLALRGRPDDTEEAISMRYKLYQQETRPLLKQLSDAGLVVHEVNAVGTPVEIYEKIVKALGI